MPLEYGTHDIYAIGKEDMERLVLPNNCSVSGS
ncbi:hypothetical protein PC116_g16154 [Phytophthora cactorum]|nr:hypothetical protein PC116_g16154 [Phytophthora cactorum]